MLPLHSTQHRCNPNVSCITSTEQGLYWTLVVQTAEFYCHTSATKPMNPLTFPRFCLAMLMLLMVYVGSAGAHCALCVLDKEL